jgi:hypothetical protein
MEGGSPLLEYLTYGVLGFVALALGILALRSAWFFLSLLAIPLTETVGRWRPFRGAVERWGERGARRDPALWAARLDVSAESPDVAERAEAPRAVRAGMRVGALLGVVPGVVLGVRDALRASAHGATTDAAWALVMGIALVGGAGLLLGVALGAGAGLLVTAARRS